MLYFIRYVLLFLYVELIVDSVHYAMCNAMHCDAHHALDETRLDGQNCSVLDPTILDYELEYHADSYATFYYTIYPTTLYTIFSAIL